MRIAIDLLWVRVGKVGGTESYIRGLLDGIMEYDVENIYLLMVSKDNFQSFQHYTENKKFEIVVCNIRSLKPWKRILWEHVHFHRKVKKVGADLVFIPIYSKPFHVGRQIPYICTIHDLQACHYPSYFSLLKRLFLMISWRYTCSSASKVITDSEYCKNDIIEKFKNVNGKIETVYIALSPVSKVDVFNDLKNKYNIEKNEYFYCVSSMLPHKNLSTILKVMSEYCKLNPDMQLIISGVGGDEKSIRSLAMELQINEKIICTGFVTNEERDSLYRNCFMFLFPSIFEGFGIPPIEAMQLGKKTIMTKKSCLYETSKGYAYYVENPFDIKEWLDKIELATKEEERTYFFEEYQQEYSINKLLQVFKETYLG